mmetsp:Transcript_39847/g.87467  ORF Transcript_39847/g.87467 Transcript_39847/m.87467 type:complete len:267 (+) Transcript_39847:168-968(+)
MFFRRVDGCRAANGRLSNCSSRERTLKACYTTLKHIVMQVGKHGTLRSRGVHSTFAILSPGAVASTSQAALCGRAQDRSSPQGQRARAPACGGTHRHALRMTAARQAPSRCAPAPASAATTRALSLACRHAPPRLAPSLAPHCCPRRRRRPAAPPSAAPCRRRARWRHSRTERAPARQADAATRPIAARGRRARQAGAAPTLRRALASAPRHARSLHPCSRIAGRASSTTQTSAQGALRLRAGGQTARWRWQSAADSASAAGNRAR